MTDKRRVVAGITSVPENFNLLLHTLNSLKEQEHPLDAIYLSLYDECGDLQIPDTIEELCEVVEFEEDFGSCSKLIGALVKENDPNTIIITFDDDVEYAPDLVGKLLSYHEKDPEAAIGSSGMLVKYAFPFLSTVRNTKNNWNHLTGFEITENGRAVDVLQNFSAVLYLRKFFPDREDLFEKLLKYTLMNKDVYHNDDVMISAYLSQQGIERKVYPNLPAANKINNIENCEEVDDVESDEDCEDHAGNTVKLIAPPNNKMSFTKRLIRAINKTREWGFFKWTEYVAITETLGGHIFVILSLILLVILVISLIYMQITRYFVKTA